MSCDELLEGTRFSLRVAYGRLPRPAYAYGMYQAALLARRLGIPRVSAIELGVAGGSGLLAMEDIAREIEAEVGIEFEIYGFDSGKGLPRPVDYRDLPYVYKEGHYQMDHAKLRGRLARARLVLGDVAETVPSFYARNQAAPVGFVSIDLDLYSSTAAALGLFDTDHEHLLPRVFCYLDDIIFPDLAIHNEWVGELLAVKEFNEKHSRRKIAPIHGLRHKRKVGKEWAEQALATRRGIEMFIPPGRDFILAGREELDIDVVGDRHALPFPACDGSYGGTPADDATAIRELERMRDAGAGFIVFAWPELWWLEHYAALHRYLRCRCSCLLDSPRLVAFDLRRRSTAGRIRAALRSLAAGIAKRPPTAAEYQQAVQALTAERDEHWNDMLLAFHDFDHPLYNDYVLEKEDQQRTLD